MMKQFFVQIIILSLAIFGALYYGVQGNSFGLPQGSGQLQKLRIKNVVINVEIADTNAKRAKGLSDRESLATDSGMLFIYDSFTQPKFWMKGVNFPLDFIWIRGDSVVDFLVNVPIVPENATDNQTPLYESRYPVDKILEVNAGFVTANNIKIGDKIEFLNE